VKSVVDCDLTSIVLTASPDFYVTLGMMIQVTSGTDFGLCRQITSVTLDGNGDQVLGLDVPLARPINDSNTVKVLSNVNELFQGGSF
jgi:hypothetical protein